MSFKEALSNFMNSYEEPGTEETTPEEPKAGEVTEPEEPQAEEAPQVEEAEEPEEPKASSVEETTEEETIDVDTKIVPGSHPVPEAMANILFNKTLSEDAKKSLTDEEKEELFTLPKPEFIETLEALKATYPQKTPGKITEAMKPSKSEPEEDWTLALFQG